MSGQRNVLRETAQVLLQRVLPNTGRFHGTSGKYLKVDEDGVEMNKQSNEEANISENKKNRKRKVCICGFDSEQC